MKRKNAFLSLLALGLLASCTPDDSQASENTTTPPVSAETGESASTSESTAPIPATTVTPAMISELSTSYYFQALLSTTGTVSGESYERYYISDIYNDSEHYANYTYYATSDATSAGSTSAGDYTIGDLSEAAFVEKDENGLAVSKSLGLDNEITSNYFSNGDPDNPEALAWQSSFESPFVSLASSDFIATDTEYVFTLNDTTDYYATVASQFDTLAYASYYGDTPAIQVTTDGFHITNILLTYERNVNEDYGIDIQSVVSIDVKQYGADVTCPTIAPVTKEAIPAVDTFVQSLQSLNFQITTLTYTLDYDTTTGQLTPTLDDQNQLSFDGATKVHDDLQDLLYYEDEEGVKITLPGKKNGQDGAYLFAEYPGYTLAEALYYPLCNLSSSLLTYDDESGMYLLDSVDGLNLGSSTQFNLGFGAQFYIEELAYTPASGNTPAYFSILGEDNMGNMYMENVYFSDIGTVELTTPTVIFDGVEASQNMTDFFDATTLADLETILTDTYKNSATDILTHIPAVAGMDPYIAPQGIEDEILEVTVITPDDFSCETYAATFDNTYWTISDVSANGFTASHQLAQTTDDTTGAITTTSLQVSFTYFGSWGYPYLFLDFQLVTETTTPQTPAE